MDDSSIVDYYRKRAAQSGDSYGPPEIQKDFAWVNAWIRENITNRNVLEVACGTGHWTKIASTWARSIVATDISWDLVRAARVSVNADNVNFAVSDARELPFPPATFSSGMMHFLLSHIRRAEVGPLVQLFLRCLERGGSLLLTDTKWVDGYRKPPFRCDDEGNTYDLRSLNDGSQYEILKNYFSRAEWEQYLASFGAVHIQELDYIWAIKIELISM